MNPLDLLSGTNGTVTFNMERCCEGKIIAFALAGPGANLLAAMGCFFLASSIEPNGLPYLALSTAVLVNIFYVVLALWPTSLISENGEGISDSTDGRTTFEALKLRRPATAGASLAADDRTNRIFTAAFDESAAFNRPDVSTAHLLLGALREAPGETKTMLESPDLTLEHARGVLLQRAGRGTTHPSAARELTPGSRRTRASASRRAAAEGRTKVEPSDLLKAVVNEGADALAILIGCVPREESIAQLLDSREGVASAS